MKKSVIIINVLGWIQIVVGTFGVGCFVLFSILFVTSVLRWATTGYVDALVGLSLVFSILSLPVCFFLFAGWGLLKRNPKARICNLILTGLLLLSTVWLSLIYNQLGRGIPFILFFLGVLIFLSTPQARSQFKIEKLPPKP